MEKPKGIDEGWLDAGVRTLRILEWGKRERGG